jgi:hypothetical protein
MRQSICADRSRANSPMQNFSVPNATLPSAALGTITSTATDMRPLQLSLKLFFWGGAGSG